MSWKPIETAPKDERNLIEIAKIAHFGGILGYKDIHKSMDDIRKITKPYFEQAEAEVFKFP